MSSYTGLSGEKVVRVVALHDMGHHNKQLFAYGVCKVFFLCEIVEGEFAENIGGERMVFSGRTACAVGG